MKAMSRHIMLDYVSGIDPAEFPYACAMSGELAPSLWHAIRTTFVDLFKFRIVHRWVNVKRLQDDTSIFTE